MSGGQLVWGTRTCNTALGKQKQEDWKFKARLLCRKVEAPQSYMRPYL